MNAAAVDCLIAVGSNLGDRHAAIKAALDRLTLEPQIAVVATSRLHETTPFGGPPGQGPFLNGAVRIKTTLPPESLLKVLLGIETGLGRTREVFWGPRTIDLDLLLYGEQIIRQPDLIVPHPHMHERTFVLLPASEIAAEMRHPALNCTIGQLLAQLESRNERA